MSQSPQAGQFNSYGIILFVGRDIKQSQSPQAGQFNSYVERVCGGGRYKSLNPLKRVNSILTLMGIQSLEISLISSQSPQAGQFNSYRQKGISLMQVMYMVSIPSSGSIQFLQYGS